VLPTCVVVISQFRTGPTMNKVPAPLQTQASHFMECTVSRGSTCSNPASAGSVARQHLRRLRLPNRRIDLLKSLGVTAVETSSGPISMFGTNGIWSTVSGLDQLTGATTSGRFFCSGLQVSKQWSNWRASYRRMQRGRNRVVRYGSSTTIMAKRAHRTPSEPVSENRNSLARYGRYGTMGGPSVSSAPAADAVIN